MGIWYATRGQVKRALEASASVRTDELIDRNIDAASRAIEGRLHKLFYPERRTISLDYPSYQYSRTWEYYLDSNEIITVYTATSGGTALLLNTHYWLRRADNVESPPYSRIEINLASSAAFTSGATFQRAIVLDALFGDTDTDVSLAGGAISGAINNSVTTLVINPSGGQFTVDVGSLLLIGTERAVVTDRAMSTTGQTIQGNIGSACDIELVAVTAGSAFAVGETILIDAERMLITDIAGNNLIVERAYDGTTLATHTVGATVYASRTFTVRRGRLGSTASAHSNADPVYVHEYPGIINRLCVLVALEMMGVSLAYSAQTETDALPAVWESADRAYGRVGSRMAAI